MITASLILIIGGPAFFLGWLSGTFITYKIEQSKLEKAVKESDSLQIKAAELQSELTQLNRAVSMAQECLKRRSR